MSGKGEGQYEGRLPMFGTHAAVAAGDPAGLLQGGVEHVISVVRM